MGHTEYYILSEDLDVLMEKWGKSHGFTVPEADYFHRMHQNLVHKVQEIFGQNYEVISISAQEIKDGISSMFSVHHNGLPFISLDQLCCQEEMPLFEVNRVVNKNFEDIGIAHRPGFQDENTQLDLIIKKLPVNCTTIGIVDDGCFTAGTLNDFVRQAETKGLRVEAMLLGIVIHGEELPWNKCDIHHVRYFPPNQKVLDWVWDRDFYPGVPLSGRTVGQLIGNQIIPFEPSQGANYLSGFGDISGWASIPHKSHDCLTKFCLNQGAKMFSEIEYLSSRTVTMTDLDRWPYGIDFQPQDRIVSVLDQKLRNYR